MKLLHGIPLHGLLRSLQWLDTLTNMVSSPGLVKQLSRYVIYSTFIGATNKWQNEWVGQVGLHIMFGGLSCWHFCSVFYK